MGDGLEERRKGSLMSTRRLSFQGGVAGAATLYMANSRHRLTGSGPEANPHVPPLFLGQSLPHALKAGSIHSP